MKVVITNAVTLNGGDAAILEGVIVALKDAYGSGVTTVVLDKHAEVAARYYPEWAFSPPLVNHHRRLGRLRRHLLERVDKWRLLFAAACVWLKIPVAARLIASRQEVSNLIHYSTANLVVSTGGTYLVEHYRLAERLLELRIVGLLGRPLVFFTQSLGPFDKPQNRKALRRIFRKAALVLLRDERSAAHLRAIGVSGSKIQVCADAAFLIGRQNHRRSDVTSASGGMRVAVSVREWRYFRGMTAEEGMRSYKGAIGKAVVRLVRENEASVTFVSTCQGVSEYDYDDAAIAKDIFEMLPADVQPRVQVNDEFVRPRDLIEMLGTFHVTIATRMHFAILSLLANTPVLPIAYEFKTEELFKQLGLGHFVQQIDEVDGDRVAMATLGLYNSRPRADRDLRNRVDRMVTSAQQAVTSMKEVLAESASRDHEAAAGGVVTRAGDD